MEKHFKITLARAVLLGDVRYLEQPKPTHATEDSKNLQALLGSTIHSHTVMFLGEREACSHFISSHVVCLIIIKNVTYCSLGERTTNQN